MVATPPVPVLPPAPAPAPGAARMAAQMQARGHRFEFFQAVRLLAASRGGPHTVGGPEWRREAVRITPDPAGVFPASDVRRIDAGSPAHVTVGFGGLYGIDAALPGAFHEQIATRAPHTVPLRDFLDLLSHRTYATLWRAWAKYRPEVRAWGGSQRDPHAMRAAALAGLGEDAERAVPVPTLLPFAARFAAWSRNAEGLTALLEHVLGHRVRVLENVPRTVQITDRPRLGTARLGCDAVVGERLYDEAGMFRVEVGPLGLADFRRLLPGEAGAQRLAALVGAYTSDALDYDVDLLLKSPEAPPLRLGDDATARLGRNAHVGTPRTPLVRRRVRYAARPLPR